MMTLKLLKVLLTLVQSLIQVETIAKNQEKADLEGQQWEIRKDHHE